MRTSTSTHFQPPLASSTVTSQDTDRGSILLLHIGAGDTAVAHAVILVRPPSGQHATAELTVGRPLPDCPEFAVARIWHDAIPLDARRLTRYPGAIPRLCPICTPEPD